MAATTEIAWAHSTFNPWIGCQKVAPGCTNCYAEAYANRYGKAKWGPHGTRVKTSDSYWKQPIKWNLEAGYAQERRLVFCASLADVFEDWSGEIHSGGSDGGVMAIDDVRSRLLTMDDMRRQLFGLIDATPWLDWLLLTKRPENIRRMWCIPANDRDASADDYLRRDNVWLLTSVSEQDSANHNIPELLTCRDLAPVLGVSAEPLLGKIDLAEAVAKRRIGDAQPNWIIVGGESGDQRRDCSIEWIADIVLDCRQAGVPCFVKQDSAFHAGRQGRIPDDIWSVKQFPSPAPAAQEGTDDH